MTVTWDDDFKVYPDGSQADFIEGHFVINGEKYEIDIIDHTCECAKEDDYKIKRRVPFAYEIKSIRPFKPDSFLKYGLTPYNLCSAGIDENIGYNDGTSKYRFTGKATHTIKDVERLVELAVIDSFQFNYEAEFAVAKARLDDRRKIMDEVNEYKSSLEIEEEMV